LGTDADGDGEGDDDPMTAWHRLGGSWRRPTPMPTATEGGRRHRTT
jgi:hypothetical protein